MKRRAASRVSSVSDGASIPSGERVKRAMYISALRVCQEIFPAVCCPRETVSANAQAKMSVAPPCLVAEERDATDDERPATRRGGASADGLKADCPAGRSRPGPQ